MRQLRDNTDAYRSRVISIRRKWLVGCLICLLLPVLVIGLMIARLDPNRFAPAIIAAVDQATGRQLVLDGPITINFSFSPQINIQGIRLKNPPGFADPNLLAIDQISAKIALLPLFSRHIDVLRLLLTHPTVRLERNPDGQANWDFSPTPAEDAAPNPTSLATPANGSGYKLEVETVTIDHGLLVIGSSRRDTSLALVLTSLTGTADSLAAPLHLDVQAKLGSSPLTISGIVGPIARFSGLGAGPWPVALTLKLGNATATVDGAVEHPRSGQGYDLTLAATVPDLEDLTQAVPAEILHGWTLPALHDLRLGVRILDQNSTVPAIEDLSISTGRSNLSAYRPGVMLNSLDVAMAALTAPLSIYVLGEIGTSPFTLSCRTGPVEALINPSLLPPETPQGSFPISLNAQLGAARVAVNGAVSTPQTLAGVALGVNAAIPDLSLLSPVAGQTLPDWKNILLQATVIDPGGLGLRQAVGIDGLAVTMDNADFGGDASLFLGAQPRLQLALKFIQLNLDGLLAGMTSSVDPLNPEPAAGIAASGPARDAIPDLAVPVKALKTASADVQISADRLIWRKATYTALQSHAVLANGVLTLDPVTGQVPGGSMTADATLDTTKNPTTEALNLNAPALALSPFLAAFGLPDTAEGTVEAKILVSSAGNDLPAIAAGLDGQFGLAMVNGTVDGSVMDDLFGTVLRTVGLPSRLVSAQGPVRVRCMALRLDSENGVGTIRALTLDSSRLLVQGGGSVDFANEALNIVVRPQLDFLGTEVGVPVLIGGRFDAPTTTVAPLSTVQAAARAAIGLPVNIAQEALGANTIFGKAASLLDAGRTEDVCPAALYLGRLGLPGPAAPPEEATAPATLLFPRKLSGPRNLLETLFGK